MAPLYEEGGGGESSEEHGGWLESEYNPHWVEAAHDAQRLGEVPMAAAETAKDIPAWMFNLRNGSGIQRAFPTESTIESTKETMDAAGKPSSVLGPDGEPF